MTPSGDLPGFFPETILIVQFVISPFNPINHLTLFTV